MVRNAFVLAALVCLLAGPALATDLEREGLGSSNKQLAGSSFQAGHVAFTLFAGPRVDVASLIQDVDLEHGASAQAISDLVNARRKSLYPNEEIILTVTPRRSAESHVTGESSLVKAIFWWNNTNCSTCYWWAQYTSATATAFTDDVQGSYLFYDLVGSSGYVLRYTINDGGAASRATYGKRTLRGFKGAANGVDSQADVVLYFFN